MVREDPGSQLDVRHYFSREAPRPDPDKPHLVLTLVPAETVDPGWIVADVGPGTKPSFDFDQGGRIHVNAHTERGMASYISKDRSVIFRNKHSTIHKPAQKIMLAEEKGGPSDGIGSASIDDGRWIPPGYPLTERHGRRGHVTFADGHIEAVPRAFADSGHPEHYAPEL